MSADIIRGFTVITFEAKLYIFQKYFMTFFKIFIRLDGRAKKACPAT